MGRTRQHADGAERELCFAIDKLDEFQQFERNILPLLQRSIVEKWKPARLRRELASYTQGLIVQKALNGNIGAVQDILNRYEGIARRRINRTNECVGLTKAELVELALKKLE